MSSCKQMEKRKEEEQTGITYKLIKLKRCAVTFTFQRTVGASSQRREIGPTQVCAFHHTADDTRLTEKISSSVRRNSLFLFLFLFLSLLLLLRDSQSDRWFSCVSLPSMNVTECECARAASRAQVKWSWGIVLAPGAEVQPPRGEDAKCVCTLTTDWGPTRMSECTVWKSASCLWRETATLSCASLF